MKKVCISLIFFLIIILSFIGLTVPLDSNVRKEYLRIHVRANSNEDCDQQIKYAVKEAIVEYLTPFIADCNTKEDAQKMLNDNLDEIEEVSDKVLKTNGFNYHTSASIKREDFPTRIYGNVTLEEGFYDALIINLGTGEGNNWWCVVYPPLCFVGEGTSYVYSSKIVQIINDFFE